MNDKMEGKNYSIILAIFLFIAICFIFMFVLRETILACSVVYIILALVFVQIAREKADENQDVRTNLLLIKFYLRSAFFLIIISSVIVLIFIINEYWLI